MHDDRELLERRIDRELWERVLPLVHVDRRQCTISAGPSPQTLAPFAVGTEWGRPWQTTWFELTAEVPEQWLHRSGTRIEAVIDLGFTRSPAGFQAEGLVVDRERLAADGTVVPLQGIHPRRTGFVVDPDRIAADGTVTVLVEAASNPTFPQFSPSPDGLPETAVDRALYRFRTADLVLVDLATESLAHDLDVLDGHMRTLPLSDPRRAQIRQAIVEALDAIPDVSAARSPVRSFLEQPAVAAPGRGRHRIVATGHAHIDTAWLWPIRETIRKCTRTFASAVALMDDDPSYVFSCSQAQQYAWIEDRHPDVFDRIRERVERGQWVPVGGMWVEADMNLPSGESLARQIVFGQRYFESRFGRRCREVWIPDVFGYPAGLPQLFVAGGMDRFVTQKLSWNKQNRFPHHTFWWEGLDGSRVLTHFPPVDTYNAEITPEEVARSIERFQDHAWSGVSLMPFGHGDGGGGPTREMLERAARLAGLDHRAELEIGTAADVFTAIEREATRGASVPVWRGELYFEMHRGTLTSQLRTKLGNRRCERLLVEAELWAATLGRPADVDDLWTEVLTQQFHDILPGSSIAWVHRDAEEVFDRVGLDLESRIAALLAELTEQHSGAAIANPADAPVDGVVIVPAEHRGALEDADAASISVSCQALADGAFAAWVTAPPLGVVGLDVSTPTDRVVVSDSSMTNGHLAVRWGRTGELTSVIDLATRRELVPDGAMAAALLLGRDRPVEYDAWDLESWTRANSVPVGGGSVTVDDSGPIVGRATVARSFGASTAMVTYELHAGARQLLVHVDLDWHHDEHLLSMSFPLDVRADTAACDVQFGVTHRPTHPSSPWDAAKFEVCAHRYVSIAEPSFGAAVINDGRYGHAVFDGAISVSLARAAKYPDPDADHGRHRVTLALRPHGGDLADVRAAAARLNRPVRIVRPAQAFDPAERSITAEPIITVSSDRPGESGVEVDAVKLADDGSGDLIVRLHEAVGDRCRLALRGRGRIAMAWRCNLLEEPERGEEVGDGVVSTPLRPFELVTLRLRFAASDFDGR